MNAKKMADLSIEIIRKYYENDTSLFIDHVDENILWYGPAKGQFLSGRQAIIDAWSAETHSLTFTMGDTRIDYISSNNTYCEVMASFPITTHFPDKKDITMDQVIHITWCERTVPGKKGKQPRMLVVHISDLYHKHEADNIYPVHFNMIYNGYVPVVETGQLIYFQGIDSFDLYLKSDNILWVESISGGRHSILHTSKGVFRIKASITELEKDHPDFLLRCHRCHLVNPLHIMSIRRFSVTLDDGKELSVPEKKYTAFKKQVQSFNSASPG